MTVHTSEGLEGSHDIFASAYFGEKRGATGTLTEGCSVVDDTVSTQEIVEPPSDSAGTLDLDVVLGSQPNALNLAFDPAKKQYENLALGAAGPAMGAIKIHAPGDLVPAFDAEVPALTPMTILSPAAGTAVAPGDLTVSWAYEGGDHHAIVYFSALSKSVRCYTTKAREIVIPSALVGEVLGAQSNDLRVIVLTARTVDVDAGDYHVSVSHNASTHVELTKKQ